jgi:hypothetical protein
LALKDNQKTLHQDVALFLDDPATTGLTTARTVDADHGRIETRTASVSTDIKWLRKQHKWPGLVAIGKVEHIREVPGKTTRDIVSGAKPRALPHFFPAPIRRRGLSASCAAATRPFRAEPSGA